MARYWMAYERGSDFVWSPQFGSADKADVDAEIEAMRVKGVKRGDLKVVGYALTPDEAGIAKTTQRLNALRSLA